MFVNWWVSELFPGSHVTSVGLQWKLQLSKFSHWVDVVSLKYLSSGSRRMQFSELKVQCGTCKSFWI